MKVFWWIVGVIVIAAAVVGQVAMFCIFYRLFGWLSIPVTVAIVAAVYFWEPPTNRPRVSSFDEDYPG